MTRGWWRRNAIALVAVAVLAPATAAAISVNVWTARNSGRPTQPIAVAAGDAVDYAGLTVGDARARFEEGLEGTPNGARVVAVTIEVDPHGAGTLCGGLTLSEVGGAHRQWANLARDLGRPYDPERITSCREDAVTPYTLSIDYLVPDDAAGPFSVNLFVTDALPRFALFTVEP